MISRSIATLLLIVGLGAFAPSHAGCLDQVTGDIGNNFTSAVMCTNTLSKPSYQISYYEDRTVMFSMFSFDKLNAGYLCISHGEFEGDNLQCRKTGLRAVPQEFKNGNSTVEIFDLSVANQKSKFESLFEDEFTYATSQDSGRSLHENCFVGLRDNTIFMAFNSRNVYPLSNCLFAFEQFLQTNPKIALKLR